MTAGIDLRYPIGPLVLPSLLSSESRAVEIARIEQLPDNLARAVEEVGPERLEHPYRPGGWTGRQVVHHLADSHANAWIRFKLGLTEDSPTIRPYDEKLWAQLPDHRSPVAESLDLIRALHVHWVSLLHSITDREWLRTVHHPESGIMTLDDLLANYAWHGDHHVAHIRQLLQP